jgi:hypothetical protein
MANKHIGSSFDDFLKEEGLLTTPRTPPSNVANSGTDESAAHHQTKDGHTYENKPRSSGSFSPSGDTAVQLDTIQRAASAVGCRLVIKLETNQKGKIARRP